jgi:hypothetical protein
MMRNLDDIMQEDLVLIQKKEDVMLVIEIEQRK